jgi:hypothetical protein
MIRNTMWLSVGSVVTVAALASGTFNIVGLLAHEMESRVETFDAQDITSIDVDNDAGAVSIEGADVDTITVRARIGHGLRRSGSSVGLDGSRLVIHGSCPIFGSEWCDVRYTIQVPRGIDVQVTGDNDGISISNMSGAVELHSDNGSIRASDLQGDVQLSSDNGGIRATGLSGDSVSADTDNGSVTIEMIDAPRTVQATSANGSVTIVVPRGDQAYAVDITTDNGQVDNQLRTDSTSDRRVVVRSDNGSVTARYPS